MMARDEFWPILVDAAEAGRMLGRSRSWIYAHHRELPHMFLPGGGLRFRRDALEEWARRLEIAPAERRVEVG